MSKLLEFAEDTKDINPNLLKDIQKGIIKPCKMLDIAIERFYKKNKNCCSSCKHWVNKECLLLPFGGWDNYNDTPCEDEHIETSSDFGCNKWESIQMEIGQTVYFKALQIDMMEISSGKIISLRDEEENIYKRLKNETNQYKPW